MREKTAEEEEEEETFASVDFLNLKAFKFSKQQLSRALFLTIVRRLVRRQYPHAGSTMYEVLCFHCQHIVIVAREGCGVYFTGKRTHLLHESVVWLVVSLA